METKLEDYVFSGQEELGEAYNPLRAGTDCEWLFIISCVKLSMRSDEDKWCMVVYFMYEMC